MDTEIDNISAKRLLAIRLLRWAIGIAVVVAVAFFAYRYFVHKPSAAENRAANEQAKVVKPVTITADRVSTRSVRRSVDVVGTLYGFEEIVISSNVEGRIRRVVADVGDRVEANSKLAEIDPTNFELNVRQSQRSLDVELAGLGLTKLPTGDFDIKELPMVREAQSRLKFAGLTESRTRELSRSNAVSAQDLDSVVADLQTAEANYENKLLLAKASLATIKLRDEALAIAQQQLQDTMIRAPSPEHPIPFAENEKAYAVSSRSVSEGTFVRTGGEVCRLVIDSALRLRVQVPERHLATVAAGQPAEVTTSAYPDPITGKVSLINPVISANTRTFEVEILIDNSSRRLKPGGFAKAKIITNQNDTAVSVPLESLVTFAGITKVFLVESGYSKEVQVTVGEQGLDWVEVVSPILEPGSVIVTSGQTALADNTPVVERAAFPEKSFGAGKSNE